MAVDHYRTLDVGADATGGELRAAYLKLARENHPDRFGGRERRAAEARMQAINEAWNVVGSAHRRLEYDRCRLMDEQSNRREPAQSRGHRHFRPFDGDTVRPDIDLDPSPLAGSRQLPRWVSLMPITLVVAGIALMGFGLLVDAGSIIAFSAAMFVVGAAGFVMVPLLVMSRAERDPGL